MENIAVCVAENIIKKEMLEEVVYSIIYNVDLNEDLKYRLVNGLMHLKGLLLVRMKKI